MNTDHLIGRLARDLAPVRPLRSPWRRAAAWLAGAVVYLGLVTALMTSDADVAASAGRFFAAQQMVALLAGTAAAAAAFASVVPGYPQTAVRLAVSAAVLWAVSLGAGALQESPQAAGAALADPREWGCVAMMIGGGLLPAIVILRMLRRGVPCAPGTTAAMVVLAAASLANIAACLSHPHTSSAATALWHGGTLVALLVAGGWAGRSWLRWEPGS